MHLSRTAVLALAITALTAAPLAAAEFASAWDNTPDRMWVGAEYWANPMEDFAVRGGRVECRGGGNRNLALLTQELTGGPFTMSVRVGRMNPRATGSTAFRIGIQDEIKDYRAAALRGSGLNVGLDWSAGKLFIGPNAGAAIEGLAKEEEVTLTLSAAVEKERMELTLTARDGNGDKLGSLSSFAAIAQLRGLVALVNNHRPADRGAFWFADWRLQGEGVAAKPDQAWGPILWTMHTLHHTHTDDGVVLKLSAQLPPLGEAGPNEATLAIRDGDGYREIARAKVEPLSCTALFRVPDWNAEQATPYRVTLGEATYDGVIRAEPNGSPLKVAGFTGNTDYVFPNNEVVRNVTAQDPDVLFFSGDQIYEQVGGYGIVRAPTDTADDETILRATRNYLRKWHLLGWAFGDLMRDRPTVCLPDDHDVYQGNIWGEGGVNPHGIRNHARGGFAEHPTFVNAVIRTQCGHHPDLPDPQPMAQGISVFFGPMLYGRVSFGIIEDRYFKSGPEGKVNTWKGRPDHLKNPDYDVSKLDKPGLELLGKRQEKWLWDWAADWRGADFKCVLSQTIFCNLANYHGPGQEFIFADLDSNGWPQSGRRRALEAMRAGHAFHYAGDQHLPSITRYGIDGWNDAGFAFCVPSIAAGYPRSWRPDAEGRPVRNRPEPGLPNTGEYRDGFGNYVTVYGIGNPAKKNRPGRVNTAHDKSSGHGLVTFNPRDLTIKIACYRVQIDPKTPGPEDQFPGWPKTIRLADNGQPGQATLPEIAAPQGVERPVLRVWDAQTDKLLYARRILASQVEPPVFSNDADRKYRVELGDAMPDNWTVRELSVTKP